MNDQTTTVSELRQLIADFVDERDWQQFHSPKNISMALSIEASELMEHFQWITIGASQQVSAEPAKLAEVAEELADVMSYTLAMANTLALVTAPTFGQCTGKCFWTPLGSVGGIFGLKNTGANSTT